MSSSHGRKRKRDCLPATNDQGNEKALAPIDRETWSGWVEMESEPAFFNVMLKEMGVRGIRIQEVYSLEESAMTAIQRPIHALIFLFRYREADWTESIATSCPSHVWFANQTPDFACATFALLNIVNNISGPDLHLGAELVSFKTQTRDMQPLDRGDAVDQFAFVKRIHNSFASENDLLQADTLLKNKVEKLKRSNAVAKAAATKAATKAAKNAAQTAAKSSEMEDDYQPDDIDRHRRTTRIRKPTAKALNKEPFESNGDPIGAREESTPVEAQSRRSARTRSRRADRISYAESDDGLDRDADGFHFVAYMPIAGHVWKLDGLDRFPEDMGECDVSRDEWVAVVQPALVHRMAQYEGAEIEFNLMAVLSDTIHNDRVNLMETIRAIQGVDSKLCLLQGDIDGARRTSLSKGSLTLTPELEQLGLKMQDFSMTSRSLEHSARIDESGDSPARLHELRGQLLEQEAVLKAAIRERLEMEKDDEEKARHRRHHDYDAFVRQWLRALARQGMLTELLNNA